MGATGAVIMAFFGAVFGTATLILPIGIRDAKLLAPLIVFMIILSAALAVVRRPGQRLTLSPGAERVVMWSSIAEGIGIFLGIELVVNFGHESWQLPVIALAVGLHFLPIARAASLSAFYVLGSVLIAVAIIGVALPSPFGPTISGGAAALALWVAAIMAIRREARFKATG